MTLASVDGTLRRSLVNLQCSYPQSGAVSIHPATRWDDGSIVGNGTQGALAFCRTTDEELVLSHEELFLPLFPFYGYLPVKEHYKTIQQLVMDGNAGDAQALLKQLKVDDELPFYNTTDPFVGACSLDLQMSEEEGYTDYIRSTDFETGESLVAWSTETGIYHRRFFVSRDSNVVVVKLSSPTGAPLDLTIGLREIEYIPQPHPKAQNIYEKTIDRCEGTIIGSTLVHRMHFKECWASQPLAGSCTVCRVVTPDGESGVDGSVLRLKNANSVLLLIRTIPDKTEALLSIDAEIAALNDIDADYDRLLSAHAAVHGELFNRFSLRLSGPEDQSRATESMQAGSNVGNTDPALVEKACAAGRYGIISSTGKLPPLLQGVWTGTWKPRWSGDYTLNGNVQSMVAASLCGNHYECQETLMDYLDTLMDDFRENARELLGFRGPLIPWRSSTHGKTHYLSCFGYYHDFPGIYWFAGAGWFAQIYYDYYLFTGDNDFFEHRLKPLLLDAAAFYEDYLNLEKDGKFVLSPSSSPENITAPNIWMAPNATMTIAVIKQLLRTVLREANRLGATDSQCTTWQEMLSKLPNYEVGENGALKEWTWPGIENDEAHRHASHLYPLYFGVAPEIAASPELQEACRIAIDTRMAFRRPEDGLDMAFGFVQLGMAAAHLRDVDLAYECVEYLVNSYWSPAMVSMHNVHDVFNLDISGGLPAVVITMLVQAFEPENPGDPWAIHVLPCLPRQWQNGRLRGTRTRGGFELDFSWKVGKLTELTLTSLRGQPCRITNGNRTLDVTLKKGETRTLELSTAD